MAVKVALVPIISLCKDMKAKEGGMRYFKSILK